VETNPSLLRKVRDRAMIVTFLLAGARLREIVQLDRGNIDLSGLYVTVGPLILSNGKQIADFATKGKLPSIQTSRAGIDAGDLMYRSDGSQSKLFSLLYPPNE